MRVGDWLDPELPPGAAEISERGRARLLTSARHDILQRTYVGTFVYPLLVLLGAWNLDLWREFGAEVTTVLAVLTIIVAIRLRLLRRATADTRRPTRAARVHLLLGVVSSGVFATAVGWAYLARSADASVTSGYVVIAGLAASVVMIASTHRRLAIVWVLACIVPGFVAFVIHGASSSQMMLAGFVVYLPILRRMIASGYESYWGAQVSAARLDERAHEFARLTRLAGMAENATNLLHDVGNTLNGVKASADALADAQLRHPAADLGRLHALLVAHQADLPRFLADDPRGANVLPFLAELAAAGANDAELIGLEIARLRLHVEHIEVIVARQQGIARPVGAAQPCSVVDLVAAALGLSGIDAVGGNIATECAIDPGLSVIVDRHGALQILVNLLDNARAAVGEIAAPRISIRGAARDGRAVIEVVDNGHGIPAEMVERVFTRGFTTKPHGHGFGLHGSFALAQALGGELSFASEGAGCGASFRLCLPAVAG